MFGVCWSCGGHSLYSILVELFDGDRKRAWDVTQNLAPGTLRGTPKQQTPRGRLKLPKGLEELGEPHRRYLRRRGFDPDRVARTWGLKALGLTGRYAWRIWIPVHQRAAVVSWTTRAISDEASPKYLTAPPDCEKLPIKSLLYGDDLASSHAIVVEGPADAWRIGPGAVATLGVNVSNAQIKRISQFAVRAICFDNEPNAQRRAKALAHQLSLMPGVTYTLELDSDDPGNATEKEIRSVRRAVFGE